MRKMIAAVLANFRDESGATMVEYALMVGFVAAVCVVAVTAFGTALSAQFTAVAGNF